MNIGAKSIREVAEDYCRSQLATMYGTAEAGIKKIGQNRYEELVQEIVSLTERARGIYKTRFCLNPKHIKQGQPCEECDGVAKREEKLRGKRPEMRRFR